MVVEELLTPVQLVLLEEVEEVVEELLTQVQLVLLEEVEEEG